MAYIKNDVLFNNENRGQSTFHASKNVDIARKHTIKKQAFGELKNVIHNQSQPRALKYDDKSSTTKIKKQSVIRPPQLNNQHISVPQISIRPPSPCTTAKLENEDEIEHLNYFDYDRSCCAKPYKSDRQIWSEMNMFNDSAIDSLIQGDQHDEEEVEPMEDYGLDDSGCEDLLNFSSRLFIAPQTTNGDLEDLLPPPVLDMLPDFEDF